MNNETKSYRVSLAVDVPFNWDIDVHADSEEAALKKAVELFHADTMNGLLKETGAAIDLSDGYEISADITLN